MVRAMSLTKEQLEMRKKGLGGSEIAAIVGANKYMSPMDVWRAKCDPSYSVAVTPPMERGIYLEDGIAKWYASRTGATLSETGTLTHPSISLVMATPDRIAKLPDATVDVSIKSPGPFVQDEWGEPGTDEVPSSYLLQVQWELLILEAKWDIRRAHVVAPIGNDLHIYNVLADHELQSHLIEEGQKFWRDYVQTGTPPPLDGSESSSNYIKAKFPRNTGPVMVGDEETHFLMQRLFEVRADAAKTELEQELITQRLKDICGFHEGMTGKGWKLSWKNTKGSTKTNWEGVAKEMGASQEVINAHTSVTTGSRRFLPTWEKPKVKK